MTNQSILKLSEDRLADGAVLALPAPRNRTLYVLAGAVRIATSGATRDVAADDAAHIAEAATVTAMAPGTIVWRWELLPTDEGGDAAPAPGVTTEVKLAPVIDLPEAPLLMRADRVDFPLGSVTPKHTHQGPGIRCLLMGEIVASIGGEPERTYRAGGAWLERGPDPVVGSSSKNEKTAFIRVMVLPRRLKGQSSFQAWDEAEAQKPRAVTYRQFFDEDIEL